MFDKSLLGRKVQFKLKLHQSKNLGISTHQLFVGKIIHNEDDCVLVYSEEFSWFGGGQRGNNGKWYIWGLFMGEDRDSYDIKLMPLIENIE